MVFIIFIFICVNYLVSACVFFMSFYGIHSYSFLFVLNKHK